MIKIKHLNFVLLFIFNSCMLVKEQSPKLETIFIKKDQDSKTKQDLAYFVNTLKQSGQEAEQLATSFIKKEWPETILSAKRLLRKRPYHEGALIILASSYYAMGEYGQANYYANLILQRKPNHASALSLLGLVKMETASMIQDYQLALQYFSAAFEKSNHDIAPGLNLGSLYLELGQAASAEDTLAKVLKRCGGCSEALSSYSETLRRQGKVKQLRQTLEHALKQASKTPVK